MSATWRFGFNIALGVRDPPTAAPGDWSVRGRDLRELSALKIGTRQSSSLHAALEEEGRPPFRPTCHVMSKANDQF
jgi:hypothetical protein